MTLLKKKYFGNSEDKTEDQLKLIDCFSVKYDTEKNENVVSFPTLCVCGVCHGYTSIFMNGKSYNCPDLAAQLALIQYGYATIKRFDNGVEYRPCLCKEEAKQLEIQFNNLPINVIGAWKESYISSCYYRYNLIFETSAELSVEEQELARKYISIIKKAPNKTYISKLDTHKYNIYCEVDSSD